MIRAGPPEGGRVEERPGGTGVLLRVEGRVDVRALLRFHGQTDRLGREGARRFVVDLRGLTGIEPEALGFLDRARLDLAGHDAALAVVGVPPALAAELAIACAPGVPVCDEVVDALAAIDALRARARAARPRAEALAKRRIRRLPGWERLLLWLVPAPRARELREEREGR